ncbi:DNA-binding domain-containing protein [Chitinimonas sp.]|uniref:DNA-binding domain-containing protein n=1 Tax=Chitinimonas sp. TaxID=1934313 RepID=UPI002F9554E4
MLAELQRDFRHWLIQALPDAAERLGGEAGLAIYQNNYRTQLVGSLKASYPLLQQWLGEARFLATAVWHIDRHPPHAWTLDAYAEGFETTLIERFPDNPDVHELAWLEAALGQAFVAADAAPLPAALLAEIDWERARLQLTPSLQCRDICTNAEAIWSALWQEQTPPEAEMLAEPAGLTVWRRDHTCQLRQVDTLELAALQQLQIDGSFAALCTLLVSLLGEAEGLQKAGALLVGWLANELIVGVNTPSTAEVMHHD